MSKKRSPRYPSMSLEEAISKVEAIFQKEHRNPMPKEVAVQHMGYGSVNGASLGALASLKMYGLLEGRGDELRVSPSAICIIVDAGTDDQTERSQALRGALQISELFADLSERFGKTPTETNLSAYLTKSGFRPDAARTAARSYIESVAFVERETVGYNVEDKITSVKQGDIAMEVPTGALSLTGNPPKLSTNMRQETFALDNGEVTIQWPSKMSKESFEDFSDWLDILKRKVRRSIEHDEAAQDSDEKEIFQ